MKSSKGKKEPVKKQSKKQRKTKKNRRNQTKHAGMKPHLNLKTRYEEIVDIGSYWDQLNEKEKEWLNSFTEEYVNANFNHKGKKLHKTKAQKKSVYDRNNARNRDVFTKARASGSISSTELLKEEDERKETVETMIDVIDLKKIYKSWDGE